MKNRQITSPLSHFFDYAPDRTGGAVTIRRCDCVILPRDIAPELVKTAGFDIDLLRCSCTAMGHDFISISAVGAEHLEADPFYVKLGKGRHQKKELLYGHLRFFRGFGVYPRQNQRAPARKRSPLRRSGGEKEKSTTVFRCPENKFQAGFTGVFEKVG